MLVSFRIVALVLPHKERQVMNQVVKDQDQLLHLHPGGVSSVPKEIFIQDQSQGRHKWPTD